MAIREPVYVPPPTPQTVSSVIAPHGMMRKDFLAMLANKFGWTAGVEIGVAGGETIEHLLAKCPQLHMVGVDARRGFEGHAGPQDFVEWDHAQLESETVARVARFDGRCTLLTAISVEAAGRCSDGFYDFVFIDADHSEAGCRADILAWLPKLKATGWLLGHDINWPGVQAAVDDLVPGYRIGPDVVWFRPVHPAPGWERWLHE